MQVERVVDGGDVAELSRAAAVRNECDRAAGAGGQAVEVQRQARRPAEGQRTRQVQPVAEDAAAEGDGRAGRRQRAARQLIGPGLATLLLKATMKGPLPVTVTLPAPTLVRAASAAWMLPARVVAVPLQLIVPVGWPSKFSVN